MEALIAIHELDAVIAVKNGLTTAEKLKPKGLPLPLEEGKRRYLRHVGRNRVAGGVRGSTLKRYRTVLEKFLVFAMSLKIKTWNAVDKETLHDYADYLQDEKGRAYRTVYLELTTLKQAVSWMAKEKLLPKDTRIAVKLTKPKGTDTYCWKMGEFRAMLEFCQACPELAWLYEIVLALGVTGMRISELLALRWSKIDLEQEVIRLADETASSRRGQQPDLQTLKSGEDRAFPIHEDLLSLLRSKANQTGHVFMCRSDVPRTADAIRKAFVRDVLNPLASKFPAAEGEVGFVNGRLHSFRHFFCSLCVKRGVPIQVVMKWLGHRESKMVMHYFHLHNEDARRQMRKLRLKDQDNHGMSE